MSDKGNIPVKYMYVLGDEYKKTWSPLKKKKG